ncbi:MAG: hypothetical protein BWK80_07480 [Desulfobacteraceae bacterium IS3]|nr:MAG: hypothetical protein BWK80_07480 [Desulfobacteraceae bacterium IS3]
MTTIILEEIDGIDRHNMPVTVGIPFPKGTLGETAKLSLRDSEGNHKPLQTQTLARWSDNSLKWVLLDFQADVSAKSVSELELILKDAETVSDENSCITVKSNSEGFIVDTNSASFSVNSKTFKPFERVAVNGQEILDAEKSRIVLTDESGAEYEPVIERIFLETEGRLRTTLKAEGSFKSPDNSVFASFFSRISFFANSAMIKMEFTLLNPKAATHPGGLWDLGDPGSIFFKDLSIHAALNTRKNTTIIQMPPPNSQFSILNSQFSIYHDSSGGEHWNSRNHVNRHGEITTSFKGWRMYADGKLIEEGTRINPMLSVTNTVPIVGVSPCAYPINSTCHGQGQPQGVAPTDDEKKISAAVRDFWQNFPKALETKDNTMIIRLFPKQCSDVFELQGGEQKTHTVFLDFATEPSIPNLHSPVIARTKPEWNAKTKAFGYLMPESEDADNPLTASVNTAIRGESSFFERREIIDEYGWRNFGEFYADHEAAGHKNAAAPLISHYNNQYDCIYGTLMRFAASGDSSWFVLGDQLCRHVKDIDIYHTDQDRAEYNHGLFWHTEHYIDVQTATHRCFSKKHAGQRNLAAYGGGPSLSHNYSTGLLLHYYMTGSLCSKEAVVELADFVIANMDMGSTISARLIKELRRIRLLLKTRFGKQELVELNKVYELDGPGRASGNSLNVLMNAYSLTHDSNYLEKAELLICCCIHPKDDIEKRDLLDAENRWMYTVFLQSLAKYLDIKTEAGQFDSIWHYAEQSLIHYAKWMAENEYPYLDKPEKLEYPNETWAAQDIRKCNILLSASIYCEPELRHRIVEKAQFFYEQAAAYLLKSESRTLTRPLALIMLNSMMYPYFRHYGIAPVSSGYFSEHGNAHAANKIRYAFSLKKEIQFLKQRLKKNL